MGTATQATLPPSAGVTAEHFLLPRNQSTCPGPRRIQPAFSPCPRPALLCMARAKDTAGRAARAVHGLAAMAGRTFARSIDATALTTWPGPYGGVLW